MDRARARALLSRAAPYVALFVAALAVRLAYLPELAALPDFALPAVDAAYHDYWAHGLATGEWPDPGGQITAQNPRIHARPFFRPPGYPYFLGLVYALFGEDPTTTRVVQFVLGALTVSLTACLGTLVFERRIGIAAGLLSLLTWTPVYFEGELQPPVVASLALVAMLIAIVAADRRGQIALAAPAGILAGVAGLTVPNLLVVVPFAAWWLGGRTDRGKAWRLRLTFLACTALTIAPATIRNYRVAGELVPISSNLGINLYAGNNPHATGHDVDVEGFGTSFAHPQLVRAAAEQTGETLSDAEASRYYGGLALDYVAAHPGRTLSLVARKALMFWAAREIGSNKDQQFAPTEAWVLRVLPLGFAGLVALAIAGLVRRKPDRAPRLLLGSALLIFASYLPFFVTGRYRIPLVPVLSVLAAGGAVGIAAALRTREWGVVLKSSVAMLVVLAVLQIDLATAPNAGNWHHLQGVTLARAGEPAAAIERFDAAIEADPDHVSSLHERGKTRARTGDLEGAREDFEAAHAAAPESIPIALDLGSLLRQSGRGDRAVEVYRATLGTGSVSPALYSNLALALSGLAETDEAIDAYDAALELDPSFVPALVNLGIEHAKRGDLAAAERLFERAVAAAPDNPSARANLERARAMQRDG